MEGFELSALHLLFQVFSDSTKKTEIIRKKRIQNLNTSKATKNGTVARYCGQRYRALMPFSKAPTCFISNMR